ncbi:MAG: phage portal protein [Butyrivibrio sp.]
MQNIGRAVLTTYEPEITYDNIIPILQKIMPLHEVDARQMQFLDNYEKGNQPLCRKKTYRPDIDIKEVDNVANEITDFKVSFQWGNPINIIQNGESSNPEIVEAISILNKCYDAEGIDDMTQDLARNVEITGRGYTYIDINTDENEVKDGGSYFKIRSIKPTNAFIVYSSYYFDKRPMLGVMYSEDDSGGKHISAFTKELRFELVDYEHDIRSGEKNPLGIIPIIEWKRSYDNMGCFERQIPAMDSLNLAWSDFMNDIDQNTQSIWHGNDIEFPKKTETDADGNEVETIEHPKSNDWVITQTLENGRAPFIKPLAVTYDYAGALNNIITKRALILQKCNVPQRNDNSGGSTGIAMDSATGWSAAETMANQQECIMRQSKMQEIKVALRAIKMCPYVPSDSPVLNLKFTDVKPNIKRSKTYELTVKTNAISALLGKGFSLQDTLEAIPVFEDNNQVIERSGAGVRKYQEANVFNGSAATQSDSRPFADYSDQEGNSPNIDGQQINN